MFRSREFSGAPDLAGAEPPELVLDGQQRLTSLYQALYGVGDYRYFVNFRALLDGEELERCIFHLPEKRARPLLDSLDVQARDLYFPLPALSGGGFEEWLDEVIERREVNDGDVKQLKKDLRGAFRSYVKPMQEYEFPVVDLPGETSIDAVCKIFETLNRTGVKLTVFELLVARFYAQGIDLRKQWEEAREQHDILEEFGIDPYWLLQAVSLRATKPTPAAQRGDVLKLGKTAINAHWDAAVAGMSAALELIRQEGILTAKWLPYSALLIPMAAVWSKVDERKGAEVGQARTMLSQYFWCSVFTGSYDSSPNSQASRDVIQLEKWLDGGPHPDVIKNYLFDPDELLVASTGRRALYRAVVALTLRQGAKDFHTGQDITPQRITDGKIDAHHVFPREWLKKNAHDGAPDLILNQALIGKHTNRTIKDRAPSAYLADVEQALEHAGLKELLDSHLLPSDVASGLRSDDYDRFLLERQELILAELEKATGRTPRPIDEASAEQAAEQQHVSTTP
ncbi:MAG TPA: DUF262 domain-containing protein [Solirubrobacteraceae bacterium]|jgi:hypothetical protein|nr:DUF262 domain-containing protein [Solirubrobacteraceae bacterium]